jgi:hypothetical protein
MSFEPLFTTARVVTAIYRITSTTLLLYYIAKRLREGRTVPRASQRYREIRGYVDDQTDPP